MNLTCRKMSSSNSLPDYGLKVELFDSEVTVDAPIHAEPINVVPMEPDQFNHLEEMQFLLAESSEDEVMQPVESEPESDIEEEEPSPLANPPIITVGAMVYLKVHPLYSYEWKEETNHGMYLGPVHIEVRPAFMRFRLRGLLGGFVRRFGDTFGYRRLVARRQDLRYTIN